ncbi:hypothetical protein AEAC466_03660 [Asticcacaulis sp. AC466]|uniref:DUF6348 family protein n=1 Tax=Asticcacaulis sp. AC466 TaxID=1282362 RepID=UPI0003C40639|nr:DUF6348 family protein [Asticcacaulis sp. AC466]ESQ86306.1 hypothetical protein AEAC466_03660 [Asticcacaulis sp. AC466]
MTDFHAMHPELTTLFTDHDLVPETRGNWLLLDDAFPAVRAHATGRLLTVEIALDAHRVITELYPLDAGLDLFRDGSFPVLRSAFWQSHDPNIVLTQVIRRPDGPWRVFTGRYLRHVATEERPPLPYRLFETVQAFLHDRPLSSDLHWLSTGVAVDSDGPAADIRLDGARQPALEAAVSALDWLHDGRDYTVRNTLVLTRA